MAEGGAKHSASKIWKTKKTKKTKTSKQCLKNLQNSNASQTISKASTQSVRPKILSAAKDVDPPNEI